MLQSLTTVATAPFANLIDVLEMRAASEPDCPLYTFLVDGEETAATLTCGELRHRARAIAAVLQDAGAEGERALLLHPPGLDYIAAFFGCLYAGVIAVPAYPPDPMRLSRTLPRLQAVIHDAQASFALTNASILALADALFDQAPDLKALRWLASDKIEAGEESGWRSPAVSGEAVAFLQYTSGSTSTPKGVELTHANLLYNLDLIRQLCPVMPDSVFVSWLPPYHDMGLIAFILTPLYTGNPVVLMSPISFLERPIRWLQAISRYGGTISCAPNFGFELCARRTQPQQRALLDLSSLLFVGCGGEPVRAETIQRFTDTFAPCGLRPEVFHPLYGLAEASLFVSGVRRSGVTRVKKVLRLELEKNCVLETSTDGPGTTSLVGCGRTIAGDHIAIVDTTTFTRCPSDRVGEIWISSPSVARGYWNRPEETDKTFNAYLADSGEGPFLRTGDLGFLDGEELFINGRLKDLIIIRGTNHYAEDIEVTVQASNAVLRRGCGAAFPIDDDGQERLVIVQEIDTGRPANLNAVVADIRQALSEQHQLAAHAIVLIKPGTIPKTSSGKIQRQGCRAEYLKHSLDMVGEWITGPTTPVRHHESIEALLVTEVATALSRNVNEIDRNIAITRYGMDSLVAYEVVHRIEIATGRSIDVASLLDGVTIRQLARQIAEPARRGSTSTGLQTSPRSSTGEYPLSHGQEALWFLHELAPESSAYHLAQAARVEGDFSVEALRSALQQLVDRHPALRTTFKSHLGRPVQTIHEHMAAQLIEVDVTGWTRAQIDDRLHEEAYRPFDLERGPLLRVALCHESAGEDLTLVVAAHHLVTDLWSLAIIVHELGLLYAAAKGGTIADLPPLRHQYLDYVAWQTKQLAGPDGARMWEAWRDKLNQQPPELELAADRSRPALRTFRGAARTHKLDRELTAQLAVLSQSHNATLFMTLIAAFQVLLHRHSGQTEFLVGSQTLGRARPEWANVVGYFSNPVAISAQLSPDSSFEALLHAVRRTVIDALSVAEYPTALLVQKLHPVHDPSRSHLFQVMFALQNTATFGNPNLAAFALGHPNVSIDLGDLKLQSYPLHQNAAQLDLTLMMAQADGELLASWQYNTDLFDDATIARMAQHFEVLLSEIAADPSRPILELPILTAAERRQLLVDWNQTQKLFTAPRCIHQLFEEMVRQTPHAEAITFASESLTFQELDQRANQLAHYLHELGVGPEVPVAICLERSLDMLIGLMGILKAGGAYLPLDPEYPRERVSFMLDDAQPPVLLTHAQWIAALPPYQGTIVSLDEDWPAIASKRGDAVQSGVISTNLAYILYTSGSTGRPKGVMNTHGAVCNYILWLQDAFALRPSDRLLQITSLSFDISVTECFWPLIAGARLTLAAPGQHRDAEYLVNVISEDAITVLQVVPSTLRVLLDQPKFAEQDHLRLVLCGGEELSYELSERFLRSLKAELYNVYGPTEASVWATFWKCTSSGNEATVPIGKPIANVRVRILDAQMELVPIGVPGEMYIGGACLARGYLGRPALTDEMFVEDPFSREPREHLYKTGDLARYRPDGNIEFLGRLDHQVKIRGHRIELGEIETVLGEHNQVGTCVVLARTDAPGEQRLVAYVVPRGEPAPKVDELSRFVSQKLPPFMIPSAFVFLDALPLTANGKLDRRALPPPGAQRPDQATEFVAPRTADEDRLCEIWGEVLGLELVGIHDDFFHLGGDSLRAAQLAAKIGAAMQRDVSVKFIMQHRNAAAAAAAVRSLPPARKPSTAPARQSTSTKDGIVQIERRSLLSLFASGKVDSVQAAAVGYFPTALIDYVGLNRNELIEEWCENLPLFNGVYDTPMGRIATILLPRFADELYTFKEDLLRELVEALQLAGRLGARTVALTGLLPSATDYGRDLARMTAGLEMPQITTGHATTAASVVLAVKKILAVSERELAREHVAFLGLGSIGVAALSTMLQVLPHPAEIFLCDLAAKHEHLLAMRDAIVNQFGYKGGLQVLESGAKVADAIYQATLIVGATNAADVLDVNRLQPGTIVVDDSAPHCFNQAAAIERFSVHKDILFTEGGVLRAPQPLPQLRYVPRAIKDISLLKTFDIVDAHEITGCVFSSALSTAMPDLAPTTGLVDSRSCVQHYQALEELGFQAGTLRCGGMILTETPVQAFRAHFGGRKN